MKVVGNVTIDVDTDYVVERAKKAQELLTMQVVADCQPLVPFRQGALRGSVRYVSGLTGGEVEYSTPYAHYIYYGEVYGPNIPRLDADGNIIGWWSPPAKHPTGRAITYHTPGTGDHWFDRAKADHLDDWRALVVKTLRG